MASPFRTALVGLGVIAVCIAMASLKGPHLLMFFAGASLLCAIRSWIVSHKPNTNKNVEPTVPARRTRTGEHRTVGKVYQFPAAGMQVSDASGS